MNTYPIKNQTAEHLTADDYAKIRDYIREKFPKLAPHIVAATLHGRVATFYLKDPTAMPFLEVALSQIFPQTLFTMNTYPIENRTAEHFTADDCAKIRSYVKEFADFCDAEAVSRAVITGSEVKYYTGGPAVEPIFIVKLSKIFPPQTEIPEPIPFDYPIHDYRRPKLSPEEISKLRAYVADNFPGKTVRIALSDVFEAPVNTAEPDRLQESQDPLNPYAIAGLTKAANAALSALSKHDRATANDIRREYCLALAFGKIVTRKLENNTIS